MKYIFILGRIPALSIAEIMAVLDRENRQYSVLSFGNDILVLEMAESIRDEQKFLDKLGGTIKIIEVLGEVGKVAELRTALTAEAIMDRYPNISQELKNVSMPKLYWGLSVYFLCEAKMQTMQKAVHTVKSYFIGIKEGLRRQLIKCRIVTPPPGKLFLDAFAVSKNNLIKKGGEIVVAIDKEKIYWGKTLAVQDFNFYGIRDYGRPGRDMKIGMMPPKLAQVMINLSGAKDQGIILDPFCGTGVILQEALLAGYEAIGADKSKEAVSLAKKNIEWLYEKFSESSECLSAKKDNYRIVLLDAENVSGLLNGRFVDAIVTEGTLGPRYGRSVPSQAEMSVNFTMLENLYLGSFQEFTKILQKGGRVVITFPVYLLSRGRKIVLSPFVDKITKIGYNIIHPLNSGKLPNNAVVSLSERNTILYSRADQNVGREIVIFIKK